MGLGHLRKLCLQCVYLFGSAGKLLALFLDSGIDPLLCLIVFALKKLGLPFFLYLKLSFDSGFLGHRLLSLLFEPGDFLLVALLGLGQGGLRARLLFLKRGFCLGDLCFQLAYRQILRVGLLGKALSLLFRDLKHRHCLCDAQTRNRLRFLHDARLAVLLVELHHVVRCALRVVHPLFQPVPPFAVLNHRLRLGEPSAKLYEVHQNHLLRLLGDKVDLTCQLRFPLLILFSHIRCLYRLCLYCCCLCCLCCFVYVRFPHRKHPPFVWLIVSSIALKQGAYAVDGCSEAERVS